MNLEQLNQPPLLTFHCDGRVTVSDKFKPEETAKLVLEQIKTQWMDDIQCAKIRELNDRIKRLEEAGDALERDKQALKRILADMGVVGSMGIGSTVRWVQAKEAKP